MVLQKLPLHLPLYITRIPSEIFANAQTGKYVVRMSVKIWLCGLYFKQQKMRSSLLPGAEGGIGRWWASGGHCSSFWLRVGPRGRGQQEGHCEGALRQARGAKGKQGGAEGGSTPHRLCLPEPLTVGL